MNAALLLTAAMGLGALSFFEPCTIATHTLFSARSHAAPGARCCRGLLALWLTRSLLAVALLIAVVALTAPPAWPPALVAALLAVIASVYIVSRYVYLPVPHLEFYKLLPGGARLPDALKLGLTLPACTLPLFAVVAGLAAARDSLAAAVIAGVLFAALFTLPTAITALTGVSPAVARVFNRAAVATPFVTAALLYGAAGFVLLST